jgi:hypothetical protein
LRNAETIIDRLKQLVGLAEMGITPAPSSSVLPSPTLDPDRWRESVWRNASPHIQ